VLEFCKKGTYKLWVKLFSAMCWP